MENITDKQTSKLIFPLFYHFFTYREAKTPIESEISQLMVGKGLHLSKNDQSENQNVKYHLSQESCEHPTSEWEFGNLPVWKPQFPWPARK